MQEIKALLSRWRRDGIQWYQGWDIATWLDETVDNQSVVFSIYSTYRAARSDGRKGGGVCCLVQNTLQSQAISSVGDNEDFELLVKVKHQSFQSLIATQYFPHGRSLTSDKHRKACDHVIADIDRALSEYPNCPVYLIGDFNQLDIKVFETNFCSRNIVTKPTRKNAILDLILIPDDYASFYLV